MENIIFESVTTIAEAIRNQQVSSEAVVSAYLERIAEVNPRLNAVVQLRAESALEQAREADEALARGEIKGVLHGVPMTIKDSLDTAGVITTGGTTGRANFKPEKDATVVARLKEAGAILMGKTNTPELTLSFETNNLVYGRTNNPYNLTRSSGGSSGGAAAIVASGGAPFDIGSDYGGSIRLPAHFCGIAGIKPTSGRVPRTGHIIAYGAGATDSYQQLGPLARYVEDLALILPIIAGRDWQDPAIVPMPLLDPDDIELSTLRVAFYTDDGIMTPIPEIIDTVKRVAQALESQVALVEENRPPGLERTWEVFNGLHRGDGGRGFLDILERSGTEQRGPFLQDLPQWDILGGDEYNRNIRALDQFRSGVLGFMRDYDVLICPVNANVAIDFGALPELRAGFSYTASHNLTGMPGVVVRAGTSADGLPIGVQIVARHWREDVALAVARFVEATFGGWQAPKL